MPEYIIFRGDRVRMKRSYRPRQLDPVIGTALSNSGPNMSMYGDVGWVFTFRADGNKSTSRVSVRWVEEVISRAEDK